MEGASRWIFRGLENRSPVCSWNGVGMAEMCLVYSGVAPFSTCLRSYLTKWLTPQANKPANHQQMDMPCKTIIR
jgi:hypothetical protein